ncbi:Uu.00g076590.m01.CDS01 [Anthostomella pinea]|uniref:Uu.00g076590.m01.CDS01 n=1 Tax=Anthostomella pinea TaxID=933095 RepID=A0AAI8YP48_9PEZI|nr:Uu.00g076590.m01.CDS01 [Anthostomella pinea]
MFATRVLRQAAAHGAERTPMIRFIGKRSVPSQVDHSPQPHPASPTGSLPSGNGNSHTSFSSYRDAAQQHGPLRKSIGNTSAAKLGPVEPPRGMYWDRNELPERFRRSPLTLAEIEAIETGGAAMFG